MGGGGYHSNWSNLPVYKAHMCIPVPKSFYINIVNNHLENTVVFLNLALLA